MKQEMIRARKELLAGRETERNLPCYLRGFAGVYYRLANYNLAMQYAAFTEAVREEDIVCTGRTSGYAERIRTRLSELLTGQNGTEEALTEVTALRKELTTAMQALTAYTDRLYLHEYVLRRLAPGMEGTVEDVDSYAALEEMNRYLFGEEEPEGMLARVSQVVAELPVRMTRAKFLEWIRSAFSAYQDADAETIDRLLYMLYSASGLYEPEEMERFPECRDALEYFMALDYRSLTEKQYFAAKEKLEEVTATIASASEVYLSLMELANSLMTVLLTAPYVMPADVEATKECRKAYHMLLEGKDMTEEELLEAFKTFEGAPEELEEFLFTEENFLEELPIEETLLDAMLQRVLYNRVLSAKRLHSSSLFVELERVVPEKETPEEALDKFCEAIAGALENGQRMVNRAVMAQVMFNLPLPFTRKSDIQKYILAALENCHDMSEKTAAMQAIRELTEGI